MFARAFHHYVGSGWPPSLSKEWGRSAAEKRYWLNKGLPFTSPFQFLSLIQATRLVRWPRRRHSAWRQDRIRHLRLLACQRFKKGCDFRNLVIC